MPNLKNPSTDVKLTKEEYNNIPVHYCTKCHSLNIRIYDNETDYCDDCGSAEIAQTHIDEVIKLQKQDIEDGKSSRRNQRN